MRILQTDLKICFVETRKPTERCKWFCFLLIKHFRQFGSISNSWINLSSKLLRRIHHCVLLHKNLRFCVPKKSQKVEKLFERTKYDLKGLRHWRHVETWRLGGGVLRSSCLENICHSCQKKMIWMLLVCSVKIVLKRFMIYEFGKNAKQVGKTEFGRRWP